MKSWLAIFLAWTSVVLGSSIQTTPNSTSTIYPFTLTSLEGKEYPLSDLKGHVVMIVNVASKCGFTGQYKGLQAIYDDYKDQQFTIIGIPSNDFGQQEPGSSTDIREFCTLKYNVSFPMMQKAVVKGPDTIPLYQYLTNKKEHPKTGGRLSWNFNKFLINRSGQVVKRYGSMTRPDTDRVRQDIEALL